MNIRHGLIFTLCILVITRTQTTVIEIADENHLNLIINANQPAVVKFSADAWCGACKMAQAPFEELSNEDEFKTVQFAHVDIDGLAELSGKHGIVGVPTFVYMEKGNKKGEMVGLGNVLTFKNDVRNHMRSNLTLAAAGEGDATTTISYALDLKSTSTQETMPSEQPAPTEKGGFTATLKNLVKQLWDAVFYWFAYIVEKIKSLF